LSEGRTSYKTASIFE